MRHIIMMITGTIIILLNIYSIVDAIPLQAPVPDGEIGDSIEDFLQFESQNLKQDRLDQSTIKKNELRKNLASGNYQLVLKKIAEQFKEEINDPEIQSIKVAALIGATRFSQAQQELSSLYDLKPMSDSPFLLVSREYLRASKPFDALRVCQKGLEIDSHSTKLLFFTGAAHYSMGKAKKALVYFQKIKLLEKSTKSLDKSMLNRAIARSYLKLQKYDKAKEFFDLLEKPNQKSFLEEIATAKYYASRGKFSKAINELDHITKPQVVDQANIIKAQLHILSGKPDKAVTLLGEIKKRESQVNHNRGSGMVASLAQLCLNRPEDALTTLNTHVKTTSPTINLAKAAIHIAMGDKQAATKAFSRSPLPFLEIATYDSFQNHLGPPSLGALLGLAYLSFDQGYDAQTIKIAKDAITKAPKNLLLHLLMAESYRRTNEKDAAVAEYKKLNKIMPESFSLRLQLGRTLEDAGRLSEALSVYAALSEDRPDFLQAQLAYGHLQERSGQWAEARTTYESALNFKPNSPYLLSSLSWALIHLKEFDALSPVLVSLKDLGKVNLASIRHLEGWRAYQQKDFSTAVELLYQARSEMPGDPELCYHLGMTMLAAGRRNIAENLLEQAFFFTDQREKYQEKTQKMLSGR